MSSVGYPDYQRLTQWLGAPIVQGIGVVVGAGTHADGPLEVANFASVIVALKPTGGAVTVTIKQTVQGGPASLVLSESVVVPAGATLFEAFVLFGSAVELDITGTVGGTSVDYALYGSNTTTNAQVITSATINVQHNDALVAAEPTLDFADAGVNIWTLTDDGPNTRVKVALPRIVAGSVSGAGTVGIGTGFAVVRNSLGDYTVTYTAAFATQPIVQVTPQFAGGADSTAILVTGSASSFRVQTTNNGSLADIAFYFIALQVP